MPPDLNAIKKQRERIFNIFDDAVSAASSQIGAPVNEDAKNSIINGALDQFAFEPPSTRGPEIRMITMHDLGRGGATSSRPGNMRFNLRDVVIAMITAATAIPLVSSVPIFVPLVICRALTQLHGAMQINIDEIEATVALVLWEGRDPASGLPSDLLEAANLRLRERDRPEISQGMLEDVFAKLAQVGFVKGDTSSWTLHDWVSIRYK